MRPQILGFWATPEEITKAKALAEQSHRTVSGVLRTLLAQAKIAPESDIQLVAAGEDIPDEAA
jgi:hypothetical protein